MKKLICILLAVMTILSLAACGQKAAPAEEKPAEQPAEQPAAEPAEESAAELEDTVIVYSKHNFTSAKISKGTNRF